MWLGTLVTPSPERQGMSQVLIVNPSTASTNPVLKSRRRNSPSVSTSIPVPAWRATACPMAASSAARSCASSISPASRRRRAASSGSGRSRLPTWSARNFV